MRNKSFARLKSAGRNNPGHSIYRGQGCQSKFSDGGPPLDQSSCVDSMPYDEPVRRLMKPKATDAPYRSPVNIALIARFSESAVKESSNERNPAIDTLSKHIRDLQVNGRIPFKLRPGLQTEEIINISLEGMVGANASPVEFLCKVHERIRLYVLEALLEHKNGNYEFYQYKLLMALRMMFELKNAVRGDQGRFSIELQKGYCYIFRQFNEQLDFCQPALVKQTINELQMLTRAWQSHWIRRREVESMQSLDTGSFCFRRSYTGFLMKRSLRDESGSHYS